MSPWNEPRDCFALPNDDEFAAALNLLKDGLPPRRRFIFGDF
jgi:hypothetical protein